jgi:hypothetical protein
LPQEDSQRTIREPSEQPLWGRLMFTREVRSDFLFHPALDLDLYTGTRDRKNESRFGATEKNRYGNGWSRSHRWSTTPSGMP